jgi:hypothetical protein
LLQFPGVLKACGTYINPGHASGWLADRMFSRLRGPTASD